MEMLCKISQGSFNFLKDLFVYLFLVLLGLHCCAQTLVVAIGGLIVMHGLLISVVSLVTEHRLQVHGLQQLQLRGSVVVAYGLQSTSSVVLAHGT